MFETKNSHGSSNVLKVMDHLERIQSISDITGSRRDFLASNSELIGFIYAVQLQLTPLTY